MIMFVLEYDYVNHIYGSYRFNTSLSAKANILNTHVEDFNGNLLNIASLASFT